MILTLNILLSIIVVVAIVGLLAYNIHPLRRPLRLGDLPAAHSASHAATDSGATRRRDPARSAHPYAARRGAKPATRSLDRARA